MNSGNSEHEAIFYDLPDGTEPVADFIDSQPAKMAAKILRVIGILEESGPMLRHLLRR